ncbi:MAG: hypothetical protein ACI91Z_001240, partial [Yoonia sp.]
KKNHDIGLKPKRKIPPDSDTQTNGNPAEQMSPLG